MKLLYVCSDFGIPPAGTKGASIHLRAITRALCESGHTVQLMSPRGSAGDSHPTELLDLGPVDPAEQLVTDVRRWLKKHELPHAVTGEIRSLAYNVFAVERAVQVLRDDPPDAIIERLSLMGHVGVDLAERLGVPLIVEVNALLSREASQFRDLQMGALAAQIEMRVLNLADAIIVVSEELKQLLVDAGVAPDRIRVVANGADVDSYDPSSDGEAVRAALGLNNAFVVGFVGSLKSWHGVDLLVSAVQRVCTRVPGVRLLIVGAGPMESALRTQVEEAGLENAVIFTGAVDHRDIPKYLGAMDVAVAPFRSIEGFYFSPIKLFEYMAAGKCIVASRLGQIEAVIGDGEEGLLCGADDVDALATAIQSAQSDAELRKRLGAAARRRVETQFTWARAATETEEIVAGAIGGGPPEPGSARTCAATDKGAR